MKIIKFNIFILGKILEVLKFSDNDKVKMPPRLSLRRILLCMLCCGGLLLLVSVHQKWPWLPPPLIQTVQQSGQQSDSLKVVSTKNTNTEEPGKAEDKNWYFIGGKLYPEKAKEEPNLLSGLGRGDRIEEQLMYIPNGYEGKNYLYFL